ncbi:M48 family metalloprotease [Paenalcaligenes faecalis]|uniref:M48 family metalloprotease n=1 Tax=Paenalcaligenes faecalis TaxID=2980099 RepID=UPI0022B9B9C3|nr:M48 family metalloprotease [Paenalcaligenes faecalis]
MKVLARKIKGLALVSGASFLVACTAMDTTGTGTVGIERKQYMSSLVSEAELNQTATQQYNQMVSQARAQSALDVNQAQTKRVRTIAQRLIQQVGVFRPDAQNWAWEIHVFNSNEVNAWCMPGGKMAVYTGLINKTKATDDELAAVIGHEMAHALREHSREQMSQQMATNIGLSVLSAVVGSSLVNDLGGTLTNVMFNLPNSRTHEMEADRLGVELAARAGYDPRAAVTLWQKMAQVGGDSPPEFLSTHPSPASRINDLQIAAQRVMPLYEQNKR